MSSMTQSTPESTAVAANLLRAYGFSNKQIFEILEDRGVDMSAYAPDPTSTTGSASSNFNKALFVPAVRTRVGGSAASPSWVPTGVTLGDYLASTLGFADDEAVEVFTADVVGAIDFDPSATMGGYSRGSAQRNLNKDHWDYTGAAAATAAKGDLKNLQAHDMNAAFDSALSTGSYPLSSHILSPGAATPASTPAPVSPAPVVTAPPVSPPADPVSDARVATPPEPPVPTPVVQPAAPVGAPVASAPTGPNGNLDALSGDFTAASASWASSAPISGLPKPDDATRQLNKGTWDARQNNSEPGVFGDSLSDQRFYPAIDPVYIVIDRNYMGSTFGPMDDYTISDLISEEASGIQHMIIALAPGKRPVFRLVSNGTYSDYYDLVMSLGSGGSSTTATNCKDIEDLRIMWSDPAGGTSFPQEVVFTLAGGRTTSDSAKRTFRLVSDGAGSYRITTIGDSTEAFTTLDEVINKTTNPQMNRQDIWVAALDPSEDIDLKEPGYLLLPFTDNPDLASPTNPPEQRPVYFPAGGSMDGNKARNLFIYGVPYDGMGGNPRLAVNQPDIPDREWEDDTSDNYGPALGNSLIMPATGIRVFTSIDQYAKSPYVGKYLAREEMDWNTDSRVYALADDQVVSIELSIRDGADTTSDYAGFTDNSDDRRQIRLYIRGDIPERILPLGVQPGSSLTMVQAFPMGSDTPERIRLVFDQPDGTQRFTELPDDSLKGAFLDPRGRPIVGDVLRSGSGYAQILTDSIPQSDLPIFMRQVDNDRLSTRVSDLNHPLAIGAEGLREVVWQDGRTINILAEDPEDRTKLVHIVIYPREADDLY